MTIREVVAVFDNEQALEDAIYAMETRGFDRAAFSLLGTEDAVTKRLGHRYKHVREMEDEPNAPRGTFFSRVSRLESEYFAGPLFASIGILALAGVGSALVVLAAAGTGAALGTALGVLLYEHNTKRIQEQLASGGLLLWTEVRNMREEQAALDVLRAFSARDVHVHELKSESMALHPIASVGNKGGTEVSKLEEAELDAHRDQIIRDLRNLVEKYRAIFDWDVPDIDQDAADRLILSQVRRATDDIERELEGRSK